MQFKAISAQGSTITDLQPSRYLECYYLWLQFLDISSFVRQGPYHASSFAFQKLHFYLISPWLICTTLLSNYYGPCSWHLVAQSVGSKETLLLDCYSFAQSCEHYRLRLLQHDLSRLTCSNEASSSDNYSTFRALLPRFVSRSMYPSCHSYWPWPFYPVTISIHVHN